MSLPEDALGSRSHDASAIALAWKREGRRVAFATVLETWGSSPCPAGSTLVVDADGHFEGSVSGGCVEGAVVEQAQTVLASGSACELEFGVADEDAWAVGLACGGRVRIHVARSPERELLEELQRLRAARESAVVFLELDHRDDRDTEQSDGGGRRLVAASELDSLDDPQLRDASDAALRSDRAQTVERDGARVFVQPFNPPLRLAIVGAVHIAQHLATFAQHTGYEVTIVDPRTAFASEARFPTVAISHQWPDQALADLCLGSRDAVVTLTHDAKLDDPALRCALESPAFYVGALGSRRTQARRRERLRENGLSEAAIARIHGPVGLDIGSRSPAEIALSILAQITQRLRVPDSAP